MAGKYEAVPGFFLQDDPHADSGKIGALPPSFGLLDTSPNRWVTFRSKITALNEAAPAGTCYKVFFLGRHGEGVHNVAEAKYGTAAWDDHWSKLDGDGELTWGPDALLTANGINQATMASALWKKELQSQIPFPDKFYCSPLSRALRTNMITFAEKTERLILENLREEYGEHTCDKRRSLSAIHADFPEFTFEGGFSEDDSLWTTERESFAHAIGRAHDALDQVFTTDTGTFISITAHSGIIGALLSVTGRERYALPTGGVLPIVVKGMIKK